MQINITGHHLDITDSLRAYIEEKFKRLERHFDKMTNIHVILEVKKGNQKVEAYVHVNKRDIFADAEDENMYAAIDHLADKLDRQIKKHKEKLTDHHRRESHKR